MLAIVRLLEMIFEKRPASGGHLTKGVLWATARTLMAHRCWRKFPGLTRHLPHMLLGGTMQGVSLEDGVFDEPPPKEHGRQGHSNTRLATGSSVEERRKLFVHKRRERFRQVMQALEVLISWAKCEKNVSRRRCSSSGPLRKPGGSIASRNKNEMSRAQRAHVAQLAMQRAQTKMQGTREV